MIIHYKLCTSSVSLSLSAIIIQIMTLLLILSLILGLDQSLKYVSVTPIHYISFPSLPSLAQRYQSVFSSFSHFNLIQSKVFDDVMYTDSHLVTSAPTGSGKTVIFELAIIRVLMQMTESFNSLKIVYGEFTIYNLNFSLFSF